MFKSIRRETEQDFPVIAGPLRQIPSIISSELSVDGNMKSEGEIQVEGRVKGDITAKQVTVGEKAAVIGAISAERVRMCGEIRGQIRAADVVITRSARVHGDIYHEVLSIEAGAFIDGSCKHVAPIKSKNEPVKLPIEVGAFNQEPGPIGLATSMGTASLSPPRPSRRAMNGNDLSKTEAAAPPSVTSDAAPTIKIVP